ncbi:HET-domain-containing protein [Trichoderma longibrachiatum ATCC 18648]|uniref:HET-domain-containing protein n=1 Tax=Trichoderma longibrachiatum ATCC 18648 TaxID=983965 RepID=A0A2T4BR44_TRILO|nr:HET-domain-containing protein [Trichoderma longibrachiatum ATCC 18648]
MAFRLGVAHSSLPKLSEVPLCQWKDKAFANWKLREIHEFCRKQWIFLCPVFDEAKFIYWFPKEQRLPFMPAEGIGKDAGHLGVVEKLRIHPAHYQQGSSVWRPASGYGEFYARERDTLQKMNELNNEHLIKAIASYEKAEQMHFLFPWADGGNLADLELNSSKFRHGDIKPSNILCFGTGAGASTACRLVIADVGLAKFHAEYTRNRNKTTTTRHGKSGGAILSTKCYDTWSLGCVFLELLNAFYKDLNEDPHNCRFWKEVFLLGQQKHPAVSRWIKRLKFDLLHASASMLDLHQELLKIQDKKLASWKEPASGAPIDQGVIKNLSIQRTSRLYDRWRNAAENDWALSSIRRVGWPLLRPSNRTSQTCQSYNMYDFDSSYSGLQSIMNHVGCGSDDCSLCHVLRVCHAKAKLSSGKPVIFVVDEPSHVLRNALDDSAIISIYSDPASRFAPPYAQVGLPVLPSAGSAQQFKLLNEWVKRCDKSHDCLSHKNGIDENVKTPTRLIKIGFRRLRLVETSNGTSGKYVALSHCWGSLTKEQKFCTYQSNIEALKKEIPYKSLPKSFQDAVRVTRALRVPYLWIDSICIIQGDEEVWKSEASKMEQVFSSAYCTITTSSATSSLDGFLGERLPRACATIQTSRGPLYLAEAIDDFHKHVENSVLSTRGWVLQERALSRRTIYFTSTQVYWECGEGVVCETFATLQNPHSRFIGDSHCPASGLKYFKDERIRLIQHLYQVYSKLQLTKATDRPRAILGLQNRLAYTFGARADYGVHWNYPERTLLWQAESPGSLSRISYQEQDAVPSWSWMAYTGAITFANIPFKEVDWMANPQIPFGPGDHLEEWDGLLRAQTRPLRIDENQLIDRMVFDSCDYIFSPSWQCIVVGTSRMRMKDDDFIHYVLLVRPSSGAAQTYERVGIASLLASHISPETQDIFLG